MRDLARRAAAACVGPLIEAVIRWVDGAVLRHRIDREIAAAELEVEALRAHAPHDQDPLVITHTALRLYEATTRVVVLDRLRNGGRR